jgi:hypothetical protein
MTIKKNRSIAKTKESSDPMRDANTKRKKLPIMVVDN